MPATLNLVYLGPYMLGTMKAMKIVWTDLGCGQQVPGHQQPGGHLGHQQWRVRGHDAVRAGEDVREGVPRAYAVFKIY